MGTSIAEAAAETGFADQSHLGAATVLALMVIGQMLGALTFDHFGLLGMSQHPASPARLIGMAFLILGVVLIRR
jgi:bacterial/archaeal transporter family-2 protein